jgi:hypothetical protein
VSKRGAIAFICALAAALVGAAPAAAQGPTVLGPWGGENPFNCKLHNLGTGTDYDGFGDDDPLCVEFDKTNQNVTDFGIVDFLSQEPARVAAAAPQCFYFQRDHWTGSIVQGSEPTLWHWDGNYFFDKAKGIGGANVANFTIGGQPADPGPFAPDPMKPYMSPGGGGGAIVLLESHPDPQCVAKVDTPKERQHIYRTEPRFPSCVPPRGQLHRRGAAGARLGMRRQRLIGKLGKPRKTKHGVDRWCLIGNAQLRVAYQRRGGAKHGGRARAALIWTSSRGHTTRGIGPGSPAQRAKRRLDLEPSGRIGHIRVFRGPRRHGRDLFAGIRAGRVRWLALSDATMLGKRATRSALRRAS